MSYCVPALPGSGWRQELPARPRVRVHRESWSTGLPPQVRRKSPTSKVFKVELTYGSHGRFYLPYVLEPWREGMWLRENFYNYLCNGLKLSFAAAKALTKEERTDIVNGWLELVKWPTRMKKRKAV